MAAVTLPALSNHLPEFQGSHPYIQQEYQFPGALGGLQIRAAKPGISAELCSCHRSWNFSWLGCLLGGCREVGFCLSCNQTGLAKRCQRLPGLSPAPWHPEERGSHCERQQGGQLPPWSVQGHGAVFGCPPGAEPTSQQHHGEMSPSNAAQGRTLSMHVFKPKAAPEINREGDSFAAWGSILSTFFPGTFKGAEESNSHEFALKTPT